MKKILAIFIAIVMAFTVAAFSASAAGDVAAIGSTTFATVAEAVSNAVAGDTITLLGDVTEDVTISKNIILDGADNQYTGKISVAGGKAVTVQNVKFVSGRIEANTKNISNSLTVRNCTFEGSLSTYAIIINGGSNFIIENCKAKDIGQGLAYAKNSVSNIVLKDVEVDGATYGLNMVNNTKTTFENVTMKNVIRGLQFQTNSSKTITFINCVISVTDNANAAPVYISHKADTIQTLVFKGENDFGTDDLSFGSSLVNVVLDVAKIGSKTYSSLKEAIADAADGDVITVINNFTLANSDAYDKVSGMYPMVAVTDKKVTIDLNGKKITANPSFDAKMLAVFYAGGTGELTLIDSSEAKTGAVNVTMADGTEAYSMFTALGSSKMYIEGGSYTIDKVDYGQSMLYAGQDRQMFVSGGNYVLGNAKSRDPGNGAMQPWMFNAHGDGMKFITVTGGTYNTDPAHYHGEVSFPGCYAPVEKEGFWEVELVHTAGAEATCMAAQTCTECGAELDAIKEHEAGEYVSNEDATCTADGTKTAECIYGCGKTYTETDEGSIKPHTAGAPATCMAAQTCTVCGVELDAVKEHQLGAYVSNDDATCTHDGTKTAECIYGCGLTDTVTDEGTQGEHNDVDGSGNCDGCAKKCCDICGGFHKDTVADLICLLGELIRLIIVLCATIF